MRGGRNDAYTDDKGSPRKLHRLTEQRAQVVADTLDELGADHDIPF